MKKILNYILIGVVSLSITSCDSFLDTKNFQEIPAENAFKTIQDVQNGLTGAYRDFAYYRFYGRNVIALGDMAADISQANASNTHLLTINQYNIQETDAYLKEIWWYGYRVIDATLKVEAGVKRLLPQAVKESDIETLNKILSQAYSMRAMSYFVLVNVFSYPYQTGVNNSGLGVVILDAPILPGVSAERSTVEQTYTAILDYIEKSKVAMNLLSPGAKSGINQFYFNEVAIYALEARINLFMGEYDAASKAAQKAIDLRASGNVSTYDYVAMWSSLAISDEDIFVLAKSEKDNLSANSLNTLYGAYGSALYRPFIADFKATDIRLSLINGTHPKKFDGIDTSEDANNVPVFRKSEMYLIIAECQAQLGNIDTAKKALFYTAKRDAAIASEAVLPSTKGDLLKFISVERKREFFQEGHRWYDARRTGEVIADMQAGKNFEASKFVYPIPAAEINAEGGVHQQNDKWKENWPK